MFLSPAKLLPIVHVPQFLEGAPHAMQNLKEHL
jgi:hypothetical protein